MYKICHKINYTSKEWMNYIHWRNYDFKSFESLDSTIHNSIFTVKNQSDWDHVLTIGQLLTDVVIDYNFAVEYGNENNADEILDFDYLENEDKNKNIIGYDILDGQLNYSLLTNFGNDIKIVNGFLSGNALITHKNQAVEVHNWFLNYMSNDNHVIGSRIISVYEKINKTG